MTVASEEARARVVRETIRGSGSGSGSGSVGCRDNGDSAGDGGSYHSEAVPDMWAREDAVEGEEEGTRERSDAGGDGVCERDEAEEGEREGDGDKRGRDDTEGDAPREVEGDGDGGAW